MTDTIYHFPISSEIYSDKLHLGCGRNLLEGWLNTDLYEGGDVHFLDVSKPFPFDDTSFSFVFSEHLFEHLPFHEGVAMLRECLRVLKPGGFIRLTMPHLEFLIDLYLHPDKEVNKRYIQWSIDSFDHDVSSFYLDGHYPAMFVLNNFMRFWGHQMLYDKSTIVQILKRIGYQDIKFCQLGESEHEDLRDVERHGTQIPPWANGLESMTIEATKPLN